MPRLRIADGRRDHSDDVNEDPSARRGHDPEDARSSIDDEERHEPETHEEEGPAPPPNEEINSRRLAAHYATLVPAAMFGVLIRVGLEALATYDGQIVFSLIWAQAVGCAIMGFGLHRKGDLASVYPPLYTAVTTGLAGSVTTFSSWMLGGFESFSNIGGYDRKGVHDTIDGIAYSAVTFGVALSFLVFGEQISAILPTLRRLHRTQSPSSDSSSGGFVEKPSGSGKGSSEPRRYPHTPLLDFATIGLGLAFYVGAALVYALGPGSWRYSVTFPLLLGPPGAMLRFFLAKLNTRQPFLDRFPLGTFIANMFATALLAGTFAAQNAPRSGSRLSVNGCNAMEGIAQGFCGCLSTVSTFAVESRTIKGRRWKWGYVFGSVVCGHVIVLAILGGVKWSDVGLGAACKGG